MFKPTPRATRVLLLWPGALFEGGGNFGVPQMLNLAVYLRRHAAADVTVVDLDLERALGGFDLGACTQFDVIGLSCYSSFEYLKVMAIAAAIKSYHPDVWLVTGGYHASARPSDFTAEDSPFDYVVVGDGELPFAELVRAFAGGSAPAERVHGPAALSSPHEVMPYDWTLLERYRPVARRVASQAEIYLSRGCPYDCSFCMERAKRETAWRSLAPEEAVEELQRLDSWLDLRGWTLRVVDPLFGMKRSWRRAFLEQLVRRPVRARKTWLLIRLDLVEEEDFALMARCNVAPGFGLESGDPAQLRLIRKTGMLSGYLDKMLEVAEWARKYHVPFGANIIAGHPGETEASLRKSAEFMRKLFLDPKGTLGFLSVDPFRLYPGSPIADDLDGWRKRTGLQPHRYPWWEDGDQDFLAEWLAPSHDLTYARRHALTHELFAPIVTALRDNFRYQGPAEDYFVRAVTSQIELFTPERKQRNEALQGLWNGLTRASGEPAAGTTGEAARVVRLPILEQSTPSAPLESGTRDSGNVVEHAGAWLELVFHVLAHVDVGSVPASVFQPAYVRHVEEHLGPISERTLGQDVATLRRLIRGHDEYARLQLLAWLYDDIEGALSHAQFDLAALDPTGVHRSELMPSMVQLGPVAEVLRSAALLEAPYFEKLPPLSFDVRVLRQHLEPIARAAPWLERYELQRADSLTRHGRAMAGTIWVGTPSTKLDVSPEHVAWQVAHEATVSELRQTRLGAPEREIEYDAVRWLGERAAGVGLQHRHAAWLATWTPMTS